MLERRTAPRYPILYYVQVLDAKSRKVIGALVNVSSQGMMIDSTQALPEGAILHVCIPIPNEMGREAELRVAGQVRWCRQDDYTPGIYNSGLEFIKPGQHTKMLMTKLAKRYGNTSSTSEFSYGN